MSHLACLRKELTPSLFSPSLKGFGKKEEQGRGKRPVACLYKGCLSGERQWRTGSYRPGAFQNRQPSDGRLSFLIYLSKLNVKQAKQNKTPRGLHCKEREGSFTEVIPGQGTQVKSRFERTRKPNNPNIRNLSESLYSLRCFLSSALWFAEDFNMNGC